MIQAKHTLRLWLSAPAFLLMLAACEGSDGEYTSSTNANVNQNGTTVSLYATRREVPHLSSGNTQLLVRTTTAYGVNYIVEWDCDLRAQRWTCWEWNAGNSVSNWNRNSWDGSTWQGQTWTGDPFQPDPDLSTSVRTELSDYSGSGYNRGHICASADRLCNQDANGQTFYLSNMHPQIYGFNAGVWENMESQVRKWNTTYYRDTLWVCKGGTIGDVYLDGTTQPGVLDANPQTGSSNSNLRMPVPKYFFMALVAKKGSTYRGMAFWVEHTANSDSSLAKYMISIDELEERTGIDFFCNLPDAVEEAVEAMDSPSTWGL